MWSSFIRHRARTSAGRWGAGALVFGAALGAGAANGRALAAPATRAVAAVDRARPRRAAPLPADSLAQLRVAVQGEDEAAAIEAVKRLGASGASNAADPLIEALELGTTPVVAAEALGALERLAEPRALPPVVLYTSNRHLAVRVAAVRALGALRVDAAVPPLLERLGDAAPEVRAAAAAALGGRGERRAAERLERLAVRGDLPAAEALGQVLALPDVVRLAEARGRLGDEALAVALGAFLQRPDPPDRLRLDVVRTIARLPGAAATTALVEYIASVPETERRPSREEAVRALETRGGRP